MPKKLDLTGRHFGKLHVLALGPIVQYGRPMPGWICRCDCGTFELVPQKRLPTAQYQIDGGMRGIVTACTACRGIRTCATCGKQFHDMNNNATCSDECYNAHRRAKYRAGYYKKVALDPEFNYKRNAAKKERAAIDPGFAKQQDQIAKNRQQRRREKIRSDAALREQINARAREIYADRAQEIQAKRKKRLDALTGESLERWLDRARKYGREYRRKWRAEIYSDPERHQKFNETMREYHRQLYRQKQLLKLVATADELIKRSKK